jgi:hypothetical protein
VEEKHAFSGVQTPKQNEIHVAKKRDGAATKIMLPFADTPVITRNKEMRKGSKDGHRRSSTGLRGRRASSLIDSGMSNGELRHGVVPSAIDSRGLTNYSIAALRGRGPRFLQVHRAESPRATADEAASYLVRFAHAAREAVGQCQGCECHHGWYVL